MPNGQNGNFLKPEEKKFQSFYKRSLWWIENRPKLKRAGLVLFAVFDAVLIFYASWVFIDSFLLSYNSEQQLVANLASEGQAELHDFSGAVAAKALSIGEVAAISAGDGKSFDLSAMIANPNSAWYATFDFYFQLPEGNTVSQPGFILPNEERPLIMLQATESRASTYKLVMENLSWQRVDPHLISDYLIWSTERLSLPITNVSFVREDENSALLSFTAQNNSAYNYWQPSFAVVLWRGSTVGGVMRLTTADLLSGEEQNFSARWLGAVPAITKTEIFPEINIFDSQAYSSLEGQNPQDIRTKVRDSR